eukprot:12850682-Prorocentrum_lima.AAC.1
MEPEEFQPILDKYGDMLYAVYPRITAARALYRPGDDPSVESQASTHMTIMLRSSEGPRRPAPKRKRWPEEPPDEED